MEIVRKIVAAFTKTIITATLVASVSGAFTESVWLGLFLSVAILILLIIMYKKKMAWRFIIGFYSFCFMVALYIFSALSDKWNSWSLFGGIFFTIIFLLSLFINNSEEENSMGDVEEIIHEFPEEDIQANTEEIIEEDGINITACIAYFSSFRKKYNLTPDIWDPIKNKIIFLKKRLNDPTLYLGILGDFSSGKSTFINAALGFELLKEDILQGTTCAPTVLRSGKCLEIHISFNDGKESVILKPAKKWSLFQRRDKMSDLSTLLPAFHSYTANEEVASTVSKVEIYLPVCNDLLDSNIAIVDTPGLNSSTNQRHDEVTKDALHNICDTAMILTPAKNTAQKNLVDFVKAHLLDIQSRCVLMQTKIDELDPEEREHMKKYVSERFHSETGIKFAHVFGSAAFYVIDRKGNSFPESLQAQIPQFREDFKNIMCQLKTFLEQSRKNILLEKVIYILKNDIIPMLTQSIMIKKTEYEKRRNVLKENSLTDLDSFLGKKLQEYSTTLENFVVADSAVSEGVGKLKELFRQRMNSKIYSTDSRDELKNVMSENVIIGVFNELKYDITSVFEDDICFPLKNCVSESLNNFHTEFMDAYKRLKSLTKNSVEVQIDVEQTMESGNVSIGDYSGNIDGALVGDVAKTIGGAGAGAVIGSFLLPGIGTVLGGFLGGLIGLIFRKSLSTLQEEASDKIWDISEQWGTKLTSNAYAYIEKYRESCQEAVVDALNLYTIRFGEEIKKIIAEEQKQQQKLLNQINIAEEDIAMLSKITVSADRSLNMEIKL